MTDLKTGCPSLPPEREVPSRRPGRALQVASTLCHLLLRSSTPLHFSHPHIPNLFLSRPHTKLPDIFESPGHIFPRQPRYSSPHVLHKYGMGCYRQRSPSLQLFYRSAQDLQIFQVDVPLRHAVCGRHGLSGLLCASRVEDHKHRGRGAACG